MEGKIYNVNDIRITKDVIKKTYVKSFFKPISKALNYYSWGDIILVSGKTGDGKSTFLAQEMAALLDQNFKIACFSGELPKQKFKFWLYRMLAGEKNLIYEYDEYLEQHTAYIPEHISKEIDEYYSDSVFLVDYKDGIAREKDLLEKFKYLYEEKGCRIFSIDNHMMVQPSGESDDKWEDRAEIIQRLKVFTESVNGLTFFVAHPRKTTEKIRIEDVRGLQDVSAKINVALLIHRIPVNVKNKVEINGSENELYNVDAIIEVAKNRDEGTLGDIPIMYDSKSKRMFAKSEFEEKRKYKFGWEI